MWRTCRGLSRSGERTQRVIGSVDSSSAAACSVVMPCRAPPFFHTLFLLVHHNVSHFPSSFLLSPLSYKTWRNIFTFKMSLNVNMNSRENAMYTSAAATKDRDFDQQSRVSVESRSVSRPPQGCFQADTCLLFLYVVWQSRTRFWFLQTVSYVSDDDKYNGRAYEHPGHPALVARDNF